MPRRGLVHWQPAFERTKPNICIAMHIMISFAQGHSQIRSGDVGACRSNDRSNAQAFFLSVFSGIQHILPRFVGFQSSFGAEKPCTYARCRLSSRTPASWSRGSKDAISRESARGAKSACCKSKKNNFAKECSMLPNWDIWNQSQRYFLLDIYHVYRDFSFDVSFVLHFWGDTDVSFKLFKFLLRKSDNLLRMIGGEQQSDWT